MKPSILLVGKMYSGKTTVAEALTKHGYTRYAFAGALKAEVTELLGRPIDKSRDRALLQRVGVGRRATRQDYWVNKLHEQIAADNSLPVVIDDCRFVNEAEWGKEVLGGYVVRVYTTSEERYHRALNKYPNLTFEAFMATQSHSSETEQDSIVCDLEYDTTAPDRAETIALDILNKLKEES